MSRAALLLTTLMAVAALPAAAQEGPVLRGRVVTADGVPAAGMRVRVRWRGPGDAEPRRDSAAVDSAGRFRMPLPDSLPDTVTVMVDAADPALRTHHPAVARVPRAQVRDREHGFVLAPREWIIPAGHYAGRRVPISPERARQPTCAGCSGFWIRMGGPRGGPGFQGWLSTRFPLRVAFERGASVPLGAAPDSAAFWRAAAGVEAALGMDLFRPAAFAQTLPRTLEDDPDDVVLVRIDRTLTTGGLTTMVGSRGNVQYAGLALQRASALLERDGLKLVQHELMHVLGLGHTCAWRSVLADVTRCPGRSAPAPTPEDVAYTQLLYRVRELQSSGTLRWGLDVAMDADRVPEAEGEVADAGPAVPGRRVAVDEMPDGGIGRKVGAEGAAGCLRQGRRRGTFGSAPPRTPSAMRLPLFPIPAVLFPGAPMPLHIFEPRYRQMVAHCVEGNEQFGLVYHDPDRHGPFSTDNGGVGCVARILKYQPLPDGRSLILCRGMDRFKIEDGIESGAAYWEALAEPYEDEKEDRRGLVPRRRRSIDLFNRVLEEVVRYKQPFPEIDPYAETGFQIAQAIRIDPAWQQELLECRRERERLGLLDDLLRTVLDSGVGGAGGLQGGPFGS